MLMPKRTKYRRPHRVRYEGHKGSPEEWVAVVKEGRVMFEVAEVNEEIAREALRLAANKLPIRCKVIKKGE